jgi:cyanophycinase-like exopeptidase
MGIRTRKIVLGGTSAGMAIMGKFIYTGRNGSVTSEQALTNPYHSRVTIDTARFWTIDIWKRLLRIRIMMIRP